jgi:hypothetical protein
MGVIVDRTGQRFGRLVVIGRSENQITTGGSIKTSWLCQCDCGNQLVVKGNSLATGNTKSCGCYARQRAAERQFVHGMKGSPEHRIWMSMRQRCRDTSDTLYGGRGITVAPEWEDFRVFYADMGPRPTSQHSIDRINGDLGYGPDNCRWATPQMQCRNTRSNVIVSYQGRRMTLAEAAEVSGLPYTTLRARKRLGWPDDRLFQPVRPMRQ